MLATDQLRELNVLLRLKDGALEFDAKLDSAFVPLPPLPLR
jgi:hypothetical protein